MKALPALFAVLSLMSCGVGVAGDLPAEDQASAEQAATAAARPPEYPGVEGFFARESFELTLRGPAPSIDERPIAIALADGVALSLRLEGLSIPANGGVVTLRPSTFVGGAVGLEDMAARAAVPVSANGVAQVVAHANDYRHLCAFKTGNGGPLVHGAMAVSYAGATYTVQVEVATSDRSFAAESPTAACADRLCVSLPDKFCRDLEKWAGKCIAAPCGLTPGDIISFATLKGCPGSVIGGGLDKVLGWLGAGGFAIGGTCGEVHVAIIGWSLGCQCIYL